jgi:DNA-binding FadR family transcriptional regulator
MRIAEYARCQELKEAIEMNQVLIYNWFFDVATNRRMLPPGFHVKLLEVVTGSEPIAADEAMRKHVQYGVPAAIDQVMPAVSNDWRQRRSQAGEKEIAHGATKG